MKIFGADLINKTSAMYQKKHIPLVLRLKSAECVDLLKEIWEFMGRINYWAADDNQLIIRGLINKLEFICCLSA